MIDQIDRLIAEDSYHQEQEEKYNRIFELYKETILEETNTGNRIGLLKDILLDHPEYDVDLVSDLIKDTFRADEYEDVYYQVIHFEQ